VLVVTREERELIREARSLRAMAALGRARPGKASDRREREPRPRNVLGGRFKCGHPITLESDWHKDPECNQRHPLTGERGYWRCKICRQTAKRAADGAKRQAAAVEQGGAR
jgi:hypothetical protein